VSSYAGCHHDVEAPIDADNHGVFFLNSRVGKEDVTDGLSATIFVGEKLLTPPDFGWMAGNRSTLRNTGAPINAGLTAPVNWQAAPPDDAPVGGFGSRHRGGANFAFGDGSVRFLSQSIDREVYRRLGHRCDGELIGTPPGP
jgi:prepilin-type processing-associated H-X9-DG protein